MGANSETTMSGSTFDAIKKENESLRVLQPYPLIEFPRGDFDDYFYSRQIWMVVVHVYLFQINNSKARTL